TADRIVRHLVPEGLAELWRDPTSTVAIVETPFHPDWIGRPLTALETATGTRVAYVMRFGIGTLPTPSTVIQDGDQIFMLITDEIAKNVSATAAASPS
uniref:TrkA C-terminal domain-containing protein n=1 Tax=Allorhizocola rhizosphaerae TaxID=1872709 RepID=UPI0014794991